MDSHFMITITPNSVNPIQIIEHINVKNIGNAKYTTKNKKVSMKSHIRKMLLQQILGSTRIPQEYESVVNKNRAIHGINIVSEKITHEIYNPYNSVKFKNNLFYHLGWKQIYNKFIYLDVNQKYYEIKLFNNIKQEPDFYHLDELMSLLKSNDTEFTMTVFAFALFSVTKSLYKAPKNSSVKDIKLSVLLQDGANKENTCRFIENIVMSIVNRSVCFDYSTGKPKNDIIKEHNTFPTEQKYKKLWLENKNINSEKPQKALAKIKRTSYNVNYADYPIIISKNRNYKHYPNKCFDSLSASPIYIDFIDRSPNKQSMYISITPQTNISAERTAPMTQFLTFLEGKLSVLADEKFKSKHIDEHLLNEINKTINKTDGILVSIQHKEVTKILNCLFGIYFHKNQKISYFDDLYKSAMKQLSFPDSDSECVRIYSYLLASLMSFKEYIDELPTVSPYYDDQTESITDIKSDFSNHTCKFGLKSDFNNFWDDDTDNQDDYEEYAPQPPITDITSYKEEFYTLFDQTVEIFKKRCAVNDTADHTISYEDKLILYFEQFITELQNEKSELIIPPSKEKQALIFLNFHSYFEHFELFLEKKNFHYTISKQKFNRLLFDNKILKPRYNGNDKTPPKFDYILQVNEQKYTVLAIKLEMLKNKCDELSKCP